jgi:hypothetical protein
MTTSAETGVASSASDPTTGAPLDPPTDPGPTPDPGTGTGTQPNNGGMPTGHVDPGTVLPDNGGMPTAHVDGGFQPHNGGMPTAHVEQAGPQG